MSIQRYKEILLVSGGIDSFVAYYYLNKSQTLFFDIKGRYSYKELKVVKDLYPNVIIDNSLQLKEIEEENAHIPFRNLFFFMMAAAKYSDRVYLIGIKDDRMTDKNKSIFKEFSRLLSKLENRKIEILSPFWDMTKQDILKWYLERYPKEELEKTISCYSEKDTNYCGECASCFRKWVALWSVGIRKEFKNLELINLYEERCKQNYYNKERNKSTLKVLNEYEKNSN